MRSCLKLSVSRKQVTLVVAMLWIFMSQYIFQDIATTKSFFSGRVGLMLSFLLYPFFGWLADTCFGRYTVIKISLHVLWIVSVFYCFVLVIFEILSTYGIVEDSDGKQQAVRIAWFVASVLGLGGLLANIVQFGIDQLQDGSSSEIISFLRWSGLAWLSSIPLVNLVKGCLCGDYELINALVVPGLLSLVLYTNYFLSSWLVKEPVFKNPLVTVFKVLKFAWKNKYPRLRSAYSYWNTGFCARIDLAKSEYGGPFSAADVEDMKAFWRILSLMISASFFASISTYITDDQYNMQPYFKNGPSAENGCNKEFIISLFIRYSALVILAIVLPVFEFAQCLSHLKLFINNIPMLSRLLFGMILFLLAVSGNGTLTVLGHYFSNNTDSINNTCIWDVEDQSGFTFALDYKWTFIPDFLILSSKYILMITTAEFLCAQSPSSMKGLLFGLLFGFIGVSAAINYAWLLPFKLAIKNSPVSSHIGCGSVYFFSILVILTVTSTFFVCFCKLYRRRERIENEGSKILNVEHFST